MPIGGSRQSASAWACSAPRPESVCETRDERVKRELTRLGEALVAASDAVNATLVGCGSTPIAHPTRAFELLKRPEVSYATALAMAGLTQCLDTDEAAQLEIDVKYEGYVKRQAEMVDRFKRLEDAVIPEWVDYSAVSGLSTEARERLLSVRPRSLGQAARMPGMTPAAISLIAFHLKSRREPGLRCGARLLIVADVSRETVKQ